MSPIYDYEQSTDVGNVINRYIEYAGLCCDASHEYHEAHILNLLASATYGLKLLLPIYPDGLGTNLYFLIIGESSFTRKSTAMKIAMNMQRTALPSIRLPGDFTPGGLESALEEMTPGPAALFIDEFKGLFVKMHKMTYMSGIKQTILSLYDDSEIIYRKANKKGKMDIVEITGASMSMIGNITPSFINELTLMDVEDGFLPRFAMVYPTTKPKRIPIDKITTPDPKRKNNIVMYLSKLFERMIDLGGVSCEVEPKAMIMLDSFTEKMESTTLGTAGVSVIERLSTMLIKVSMLIASGELDVDTFTSVRVKAKHVKQALVIVERWKQSGLVVIGRLGDSEFEQKLNGIHELVLSEKKVSRTQVARLFKCTKRTLDEIQFTLIDRGMINLSTEHLNGSRKETLFFSSVLNPPGSSNPPAPIKSEKKEEKGDVEHMQEVSFYRDDIGK